ncbi:MAG: hypothetical protein EG826_03820 [Deltaproteobacteria bacterium]|nr:hypothetical protein [Deltaproteobacteria bacterium]
MSYRKWLMTTAAFTFLFAALIVAVNFCVDHHAVRLSLFSCKQDLRQTIYPAGINQHIFNPEVIFRRPGAYDSFLFGSSRTAPVHVEKIRGSRFYNMSYSLGLPEQHLAILRAFLKKGIKIKTVVIGLDDFCFSLPAVARQEHLIRMMHPDIGGPCRFELFGKYFFRKPDLKELGQWRGRVFDGKTKDGIVISERGVNLGWMEKERIIQAMGKPIFDFAVGQYQPVPYGRKEMNEAFAVIEELITLSREQHFSLIFFITPFSAQLYLNQAEALAIAKERLAGLTDFYDFSGFNSITTNPVNYYEESHYRYQVGDLIIERIFGGTGTRLSGDFGVLVTRQNVGGHLEKQKRELEAYRMAHRLQ